MIITNIRTGLLQALFMTLGAAALAFSGNCNALPLNSSGSTSIFKTFPDQDLICQADDGEIDITAETDGTNITFLMESARDEDSMPVTHTCCEVPHDEGVSVADCEADTENLLGCTCGEFILDQKVEDTNGGDGVPSNCLQETTTGGLETYRCVVTKGNTKEFTNGNLKEYWVWHLNPADAESQTKFCDFSCTGQCGVAMGTTDNAKPGEYPPFGIVWQYDQYEKDGQVVHASFAGNWCHNGSFCLDDDISCEVKSAKLDLRTDAQASFTIVEVDTVQTLNGNSTSGTVPTDFLSTAENGALLVDPITIDLSSLTVNDSPVTVNNSSSSTDRNGDGYNDLRTQIDQGDLQYALYPDGECIPNEAEPVDFRGTFTDGRAWVGPTTVNVVCN